MLPRVTASAGHSYLRVASTSVKASAAAEIKATSRRPIQRVGSAEQSFKRALRVGRHTDFLAARGTSPAKPDLSRAQGWRRSRSRAAHTALHRHTCGMH